MKLIINRKSILVSAVAIIMTAGVCFAGGNWGYDGQDHVSTPANWGHEAEACNGKVQSPIDIETSSAKKVDGVKIDFNYKSKTNNVEYINNGHSVTVTPLDPRSITIDSGKYNLFQFHFHTLSEHTVDGNHYDMEMHLVHADDAFIKGEPNGKLAVLGVFIKEGNKNEELAEIFGRLPHAIHNDTAKKDCAEVATDFSKLLPAGDLNVYSYSGSLTTPGCNEIVSWLVLDKPIEMSKEQIAAYRELFKDEHSHKEYHTNRPVQPLNDRVVSHGKVTK